MTRAFAVTFFALVAACGGGARDVAPPPRPPICPAAAAATAPSAKGASPPADVEVKAEVDAETEPPPPDPAAPPPAAAIASLATTLRAQIAREATSVPGKSALVFALVTADGPPPLVVAHGEADLEAHVPATPGTVFRIASVTKTFTAATLLALRDDGVLHLDDEIAGVLPELAKLRAPHADAPALTYRHVLLHASGLPRSGPWASKEPDYRSTEAEILQTAKQRLAFDPGTRHSYSNVGYAVLGLAIGRAAKAPYRDVVTKRLLTPLGMRATTFDETRVPKARLAPAYMPRSGAGLARAAPIANGAAEGAGGLFSTVEDLARWTRFQLAAWPPRDDEDRGPLRRASVRESHTGAFAIELVTEPSGDGLAIRSRAQGLGWKVERSCAFEHLVEHGGDLGGYRTRIFFAPQRGVGFVLLANAASTPIDGIARRVLATIQSAKELAPRDARPESSAFRCAP